MGEGLMDDATTERLSLPARCQWSRETPHQMSSLPATLPMGKAVEMIPPLKSSPCLMHWKSTPILNLVQCTSGDELSLEPQFTTTN
jgi:hypothetical protein